MTLSFPKPLLPLLWLGLLPGPAAFAQTKKPAPAATAQTAAGIEQRVATLLAQMTLEEKVGQLNQYSGREVTGPASNRKTTLLSSIRSGQVGSMLNVKGVKDTREIQAVALESRLKIPLLFSLDVIHGYETTFPIPLGEAASWDLAAIRLGAHVAAKEAAASGIHWTFAPMVDIGRDPRWGRVMEGAGEDTYLGSLIAKARVLGFQGEKLGGTDAVMACAKHFAAYGAATAGRDYNAVDLSPQQLWETYLPPFKAAADAGVATFMNSFNTLNGVPATGNSYLQRDILKGQWSYPGFVVSDWGSIAELANWGYAADKKDAAQKAITAGSDMDMEGDAYSQNLAQLVKDGQVKIDLVDDAVRRILRKKFELGLFDDPYRFSDEAREKQVLNDPQNRVAARQMAQKSLVLLKNENATLPLTKQLRTVAVIGPLAKAKRDLNGSWTVSTDTTKITSLYDGLSQRAGKTTQLRYAKGCDTSGDSRAGFEQAVAAAKGADLVVLAVGETWDLSGEAKSRTDLHLPGPQEELFKALKATGKPVAVVVFGGRPLVFDAIADQADAILYAWWPGSEGGLALADVLFGDYNPAGKLPITFPRNVGQIPIAYNQQYNTGRPITKPGDIKYKSAYIDAPNTPRYAFGHGLSYTSFTYSDLKISRPQLKAGESVQVSFTLTNSGKAAGEEVAQLYLRDPVASVVRPLKELKDFQKISLKPGQSKTITFTIGKDKLAFYNQQLEWVAEPGKFNLMVGSASDDIRLEGAVELLP
ncbi:glycoside hydrolase family 3 N-terminal domain-containing protein [Hymenobacter convexus]|uniref:glycoside hydrolase family 3 N-terminal domain-containing protein n=1 Tax=Hymenobacter sp. CA1UV-4 TaxID=3063782 RepID=UPI002712DD86|nr:glycoside hydrolase family 3 N-terminal domain-containing protein [Hymenobacter sp. CA1UV-4]MDO7851769.1 glycoside hydrolase family 3 N-terminal domain-containing protein [Hymenobacter sp. CA1UV-4]